MYRWHRIVVEEVVLVLMTTGHLNRMFEMWGFPGSTWMTPTEFLTHTKPYMFESLLNTYS